jgi:hypothetical protein
MMVSRKSADDDSYAEQAKAAQAEATAQAQKAEEERKAAEAAKAAAEPVVSARVQAEIDAGKAKLEGYQNATQKEGAAGKMAAEAKTKR